MRASSLPGRGSTAGRRSAQMALYGKRMPSPDVARLGEMLVRHVAPDDAALVVALGSRPPDAALLDHLAGRRASLAAWLRSPRRFTGGTSAWERAPARALADTFAAWVL